MSECDVAQPVPQLEFACLKSLLPGDKNMGSMEQRRTYCASENGFGFNAAVAPNSCLVFCGFFTSPPTADFSVGTWAQLPPVSVAISSE